MLEELNVVIAGAAGEGGNHFLHALRRVNLSPIGSAKRLPICHLRR
jgi:hypothetical protein